MDYHVEIPGLAWLLTHRTPFGGSFRENGWTAEQNRADRKHERSGVGAEITIKNRVIEFP